MRSLHRKRAIQRLAVIAFNNTTYRMFSKGSMKKIRAFLTQSVEDRERFAHGGWRAFDKYHESLIRQFPRSIRLSSRKGGKPGFGHKAKVIDLYLRVLCAEREPLSKKDANQMLFHLHVPLDRIVLSHVWEHFRPELKRGGIKQRPSLSGLTKRQYFQIQRVLAEHAKQAGVPAVWYDDLYLPD